MGQNQRRRSSTEQAAVGPLSIRLSWQARPQHKDARLKPLCSRLRVFKGGTAKDLSQLTGTGSKQSVLLSKWDSYGKVMGKYKSENNEFAYLTAFLKKRHQMAQVQNITFTKQTGQFRASLHTLQRF